MGSTTANRPKDYIIIDRNGIIENRHEVHAAVVDATGKILYSLGDPFRFTLARSATKPAQALAVLETGAVDQFGFDEADLALMCASHSSEDKHISRARSMLNKVQVEEGYLQCGGHPAVSEKANREWIKKDYVPTAICNNCSGKHVGMLAGAKAIGAPLETYHLPTNPLQVRVRKAVEELTGLDTNGAETVKWAIDGCNLPTPAFPLHNLGRMYATIAAAADESEKTPNESTRTQALSRIYHAMSNHPDLVGGEGRFCTALMRAFHGALIGKVGAQACYGVGIRASERTKQLGADGAMGISVKIEDGNLAMAFSAVAEILEQLDIGTQEMRKELDPFHHPDVVNTVGVVTGHTSHSFRLR